MNDSDFIQKNLESINNRIETACKKSGRKSSEITLIAVSKKVSLEKIKIAIDCGAKSFGENYMQEAQEKARNLEADWHFIGHLQSNKVRLATTLFSMIQSVDSMKLAEKIDSVSKIEDKKTNILLQIHYGEEDTKTGFLPDEILPSFEKLQQLPNLSIKGLMTIPPFVSDPEQNRHYFESMRILSEKIFPNTTPILSMGMTDDFEIAIEEGANMVRVGRAIFGERNKNI